MVSILTLKKIYLIYLSFSENIFYNCYNNNFIISKQILIFFPEFFYASLILGLLIYMGITNSYIQF